MGIENIVRFKVSYLHLALSFKVEIQVLFIGRKTYFFQWQANIFLTFYSIFIFFTLSLKFIQHNTISNFTEVADHGHSQS